MQGAAWRCACEDTVARLIAQMEYKPDLAPNIGMLAGGTGITPMLVRRVEIDGELRLAVDRSRVDGQPVRCQRR